MTATVFVDTNVFVCARDPGEPIKQPVAAAWLDHLWRGQLGRTSVQVLSEYYTTMTRKLDPGLSSADAWDDVTALFAWRPWPIDHALLQRGREIERRHRLAWWDSLIVAAAEAQACPLLLSEDLQDGGQYGSVAVRNPFTLAVEEATVRYRALPPPQTRHPSRGRPKRTR